LRNDFRIVYNRVGDSKVFCPISIMTEESNRYLVYALKHHYVHADAPKKLGGYKIRGWVDEIYRDVINRHIEIQVGKNKYVFEEPNRIVEVDGDVLFVYGGDNVRDDDESLLREFREVTIRGGGFDRAMKNLERGSILLVHFEVAHDRKRPKTRQKPGRPKKRGVKKGSTRKNKATKRKAVPKRKAATKKLRNHTAGNSKKKAKCGSKRKVSMRKC